MKKKLPSAENVDLIVCFDPSMNKCGCAIINATDFSRQKHKTSDLFSVLDWMKTETKGKRYLVVLENPNLDKANFGMIEMTLSEVNGLLNYTRWLIFKKGRPPQKKTIGDVRTSILIAMQYGQRIGKSQASAMVLIALLDRANIPFCEIAPSDRMSLKNKKHEKHFNLNPRLVVMPTKSNADQFKTMFPGFSGRSSEHSRDAATLVFGKNVKAVRLMIKMSEQKRGKGSVSLFNQKKKLINETSI
jgi:hypothetical protein